MDKIQALDSVRKRILAADLPLKNTAKNLVFGKGNPDAAILILGEAPGNNEDLQGMPFVGAAGKQLDKLLNLIGLTLDDVYIANILKYRPPENRDPLPAEMLLHTPYLVEQIKIIQPKVIVTLGNFATKFILADFTVEKMKSVGGIVTLHGKAIEKKIDGMQFIVYPVFHPAAVIYRREWYADLEKDFLNLKRLL